MEDFRRSFELVKLSAAPIYPPLPARREKSLIIKMTRKA